MKKLKLNLEDLRVESFATTPSSGRSGGTVFGQATAEYVTCAGPECTLENCTCACSNFCGTSDGACNSGQDCNTNPTNCAGDCPTGCISPCAYTQVDNDCTFYWCTCVGEQC